MYTPVKCIIQKEDAMIIKSPQPDGFPFEVLRNKYWEEIGEETRYNFSDCVDVVLGSESDGSLKIILIDGGEEGVADARLETLTKILGGENE
jgi:hypothetical protein